MKSDVDLLATFEELDEKGYNKIKLVAIQSNNQIEQVVDSGQYHSPKLTIRNEFAFDEVYDDYKLDDCATERTVSYTSAKHAKIDSIIGVKQYELCGCMP